MKTAGGLTDATEGLISLILAMIPNLRVIVPNAAKSNGTLLCLASSTILMGPNSELGPIEPSVNNIPCTILSAPEIAAQNFPLHKYGVYALLQTKALAKKLLTDGMMKGRSEGDIDSTIDKLAGRDHYFSHGSVINHQEARALGLSVEYLPHESELWQKVWLLTCMYDHDCRRDRPLKVFEGPAVSTSITVAKPPVP